MDVEEWLGAERGRGRESRMVRRLVGALARKPGATLVLLALACVLLLPLVVHYFLVLGLAGLSRVGLLRFEPPSTLLWLMTWGQLLAVLLMLVITGALILAWYLGMKNTYTSYFNTHRLEATPHFKTR